MKYPQRNLISAACLVLAASFSSAQPINYEWVGGETGIWNEASNWSPTPGSQIGRNPNINDRVTIDGNYTVSQTGWIEFSGNADPDKSGTFYAISLLNGAKLTVATDVNVLSASGGFSRGGLIGKGSTLEAGGLRTGPSNNTDRRSTWDIQGTLSINNFYGYQGANTGTAEIASGYVLNVDGGILNADNFAWKFQGREGNLSRSSQINISNNGIVNIGTMAADWVTAEWEDNPGNYVVFIDGSGSLKFGYDNYTNLESVQLLIDNNYIRKGMGVGGNLMITDTGDGWLVAVPESSTTASVVAITILGLTLALRRYRRS